MERLKEMKMSSKDFINELIVKRIKKAKQIFETEQKAYRFLFWRELEELISRRKESDENLVISSLCTSIVTGSNMYQIAWYSQDIYADPFPDCFYYTPEFMFRELEKDTDLIKENLRKKYIRLMNYEMEEIRRIYMRQLYLSGRDIFIELIEGLGKKDIAVWFGEYMKSVDYIGRI